MESRKDIGKAFREKLDQLQRQPGDAVWDSIRADLDKGRKKAVPAWLRLWLVSGVFILIAFFTYPLWENKVPHIYIKMPEQVNEKVSGAPEGPGGSAAYNPQTTAGEKSSPKHSAAAPGSTPGTSGKAINSSGSVTSTTNGTKTAFPSAAGVQQEKAIVASGNTGPIKQRNEAEKRNPDPNTATVAVGAKKNLGLTPVKPAATVAVNDRNTAKPQSFSASSARRTTAAKNKQTNSAIDKPFTDAGSKTKASRTKNDDNDDTDTGFIVPASPDYKNYRNNIGNGFVVADFPEDSLESDKDSIRISDKLKIRTTGVEQVRKAPVTKVQDEGRKNFYLYAFAAPMKYSFNDNASYLGNSTAGYSTSSETNLAYGASLGYNATEKLSLRIGAILSGGEIMTDNILLQNTYSSQEGDILSIGPGQFDNIEYTGGTSNNLVRQQLSTGSDEMGQDVAVVNITTELSFVEVPLEAVYNIFEAGNFGIALKGTVGARFVVENKVFAENIYGSIHLGELKNVDDVSFSTGVGVSFFYRILPNLQINAEPSYRYFSGNKDVIKPSAFMVQAGLQYNFDLFKKKK